MSGIARVVCIKLKTSILFYYSVRGILRFLVSQVFCFFIVELLNADFSSACLHSTFNSQQFNSYQKWQNRMVGVSYIVYHIPCVLCQARCFLTDERVFFAIAGIQNQA